MENRLFERATRRRFVASVSDHSKNFARHRNPRRAKHARMGAALVEFAVVAPLMILFTLGMIEIGRMTMVKQLLVNISREGAREGTLPDSTTQSVKTSVQNLLTSSNIVGASVTVSTSTVAPSNSQYVSVSISVPAENVSWLSTPLFMRGKSVMASTSMRKESI